MATGDIKHTNSPVPEIVFARKGTGTVVAGTVVAVDSSGDFIPATASTKAPHGVATGSTHVIGATTYYGVCMAGYIVCAAGGAIKPNKLVIAAVDAEVVTSTLAVSATYVQAEVLEILRIVGRFVRAEADDQFNPSDAANNDLIIISVGSWN